MARPILTCWWDDLHVADITARRPWDLRLRYTEEAQERWAANIPALSCSLPVQRRPIDASGFLRGLLPEGRHLQALADLAGVATNDSHGLLVRYGRDLAGALVITDDGRPPSRDRWSVEPYTEDTLAVEIRGLGDHALGVRPDSELSIAGLQDKLLLVDLGDGQWGRPVHGHPSTHMLKIDDERHPGLVVAEADCLRLAQAVGLTHVDPVVTDIDAATCLIVRRYDRTTADRTTADGTVERIHQEDACQALGIDPQAQRGRSKYEDAGGPTLARVAQLLRVHARRGDHEMEQLMRAVTFTVLIGNADAHGKNVSLLHDGEGFVSLAPLYDTVPTVLWPNLRATAAMSVNRKRAQPQITVDDLAAEALTWGLDPRQARQAVVEVTERVRTNVAATVTGDELASVIAARTETLLASA